MIFDPRRSTGGDPGEVVAALIDVMRDDFSSIGLPAHECSLEQSPQPHEPGVCLIPFEAHAKGVSGVLLHWSTGVGLAALQESDRTQIASRLLDHIIDISWLFGWDVRDFVELSAGDLRPIPRSQKRGLLLWGARRRVGIEPPI